MRGSTCRRSLAVTNRPGRPRCAISASAHLRSTSAVGPERPEEPVTATTVPWSRPAHRERLVQRMSTEPTPSDRLIDPELLWAKSTALREQIRTVNDKLLADRMCRLADDIAELAVEVRLAAIVEAARR